MSSHPVLPPDRLRWKQAAHDVFVATLDEEFAGFISVSGPDHAVHGAHAQPLGVFRSQHDARAALRAHALAGRTPSGRALPGRGAGARPRSGRPGLPMLSRP